MRIAEILLHLRITRGELQYVRARVSRQRPASVARIGFEASEVFPEVPLTQPQLCRRSRSEAADRLIRGIPQVVDFGEWEARCRHLHHTHKLPFPVLLQEFLNVPTAP